MENSIKELSEADLECISGGHDIMDSISSNVGAVFAGMVGIALALLIKKLP